jgi:hypothetical protein
MAGLSTYSAVNLLAYISGKTAMPTLPTAYLALFTVAPTDAGGGTEAAFTGYARVATAAADWNTPTTAIPAVITNAAAKTFGTCTASPGSAIVAWGIYDASTGGNLLVWDYVWAGGSAGQGAYLPFSCTSASPGVITSPAHGLANGDQVVLTAEYGGTLPTGVAAGTLVTVAGVTTDTFNVGVNTTSTGSGTLRKVVPQSVVNNLSMSLPAGSITIVAA